MLYGYFLIKFIKPLIKIWLTPYGQNNSFWSRSGFSKTLYKTNNFSIYLYSWRAHCSRIWIWLRFQAQFNILWDSPRLEFHANLDIIWWWNIRPGLRPCYPFFILYSFPPLFGSCLLIISVNHWFNILPYPSYYSVGPRAVYSLVVLKFSFEISVFRFIFVEVIIYWLPLVFQETFFLAWHSFLTPFKHFVCTDAN